MKVFGVFLLMIFNPLRIKGTPLFPKGQRPSSASNGQLVFLLTRRENLFLIGFYKILKNKLARRPYDFHLHTSSFIRNQNSNYFSWVLILVGNTNGLMIMVMMIRGRPYILSHTNFTILGPPHPLPVSHSATFSFSPSVLWRHTITFYAYLQFIV